MINIRIIDILSGKNIWPYYKLYRQTQWYSKEQMAELQLHKLKKLLRHCYENVEYYRNIIQENNIDINNIENTDIIKQFPILTKEIIQENYRAFIPRNNKKIKGVKTKQTGGTTGGILYTRNDANTRSSTWAAYRRFEDWMDIKPRDKSLILMGGHVIGSHFKEKIKNFIYNKLRNRVTFSPYDTSEKNINNVIHALKTNSFKMIRSYSQFLFSFAKRLESMNLSFNVKSITTTAEPLMPEHRELFKKVFNAETFDQYGFGEIGGVAFECNHHNGLHITEEKVFVEKNENNELIVTDLENFSLPFIRYWNEDQAIISKDKCSCGRNGLIIKKIMGRTCDYIIGTNGEYLHWAYFWHLLFDSNIADKRNLAKFQIVQESTNQIIIRMVSDTLAEDEQELITSDIQSRAGKLNILFSFEKEIENSTSGKYRPVINKLL